MPVEDYPEGFPRISSYLDSDDSFMIYRRFGMIFSRLLLNKQDELATMEADLKRMDDRDALDPEGEQCLRSRTLDIATKGSSNKKGSRQELLKLMEEKAVQYSTFDGPQPSYLNGKRDPF